ncbi:hypothetical protein D3C83_197810 [compost metagenome]
MSGLDHEAVSQKALDDAIERPGPKFHRAIRARADVLDDGVAVAVFVGQRHEDMEHRRGQG